MKYIKYNLFRNIICVTIGFIFISGENSYAQKWSLQQCMDYAIENNIQLKQSKLSIVSGENSLEQSKANILPSINGYANHNYNFGRTIDPLTNSFANDRVQSNSFGVSSNLVLFNGFQNSNLIKQNLSNIKSSQFELERIENDVRINVINAYLQILFAEELINVSKNQYDLTLQQFDRVKKLVALGSLPRGSQLEIEAQLAQEDLLIVNSQNQLDLSYLNIIQILNLEKATYIEVEKPQIEVYGDLSLLETPESIFGIALSNQASIKSAEFNVLSAKSGLAIAKGDISPRLTLSASYGSGYSELRKNIIGSALDGYDVVGITTGNDSVLVPRYISEYKTTSFNRQVKDNLNKAIGFNLSIPLFNNLNTKSKILQAKIAIENAQFNLELNKQVLRNSIQKAHADALAAYKKHKATNQTVSALKESFYYSEQRYSVGMVNTLEYNDAKNKLIKAESDLLQTKFDYVFKLKILDYYLGKPINL